MESGLDHNYNAILSALTSSVTDSNKQIEARKHLRIERWLRVNIQLIEDFAEEELKFFSDIFSDGSCWDGVKLKNEAIGKRLIEEKNQNGRENPLDLSDRYYLACKYCLEDKIPELFEQVLTRFKESVFEKSRSGDELRKELLEHIEETSPIEAFWSSSIDKESGKLKEYKLVEGLQEAIQINSRKNWGEGIEFFYNKLQSDTSILKENKDNLLIEAALSAVKGYKNVDALEFCVLSMGKSDKQKKELLKRDLKENTYHAVLSELIDGYCFNSFKNLFELLKLNDLSFEQYGVILSSLSRRMLLNPDLAEQTREVIMYVWKHKNFEEQRKSVFKDYSMKYVIADLIVDSRKEEEKAKEILEILKYAEVAQGQELKNSLLRTMSALHGIGEEQFTKDQRLIEHLFSKLNEISKDKGLAIGAGEPADSPRSNLSLTTDALCNVKLSSHSK
jgi:hypothetical protein